MNKEPEARGRDLRRVDAGEPDAVEAHRGREGLPVPVQQARLPLAIGAFALPGMFSFRYASAELYAEGEQLHLRMHRASYENGRLKTEECEGAIDRQAAEEMVHQAQRQLLAQTFGLARLLLAPLLGRPSGRGGTGGGEG